MEQIHHAVLHPSERVVKLAWLLLNSELQFRVFPCSSTSWESQLKGCLCTNIKPDLSRQRKRHLLERSISKWKIYLFYKLHPRAISRLFLWIFFLFVRFYSFPICHCSLFKQLLVSTAMQNAAWSIPSQRRTADVPVLDTPGFKLVLPNASPNASSWPCCQTDVTVLTLADRACLNLLFRSCMLGDLGRGMREVLRLSGVLVVCCLLTSLQRTWKALKTSL